MGEVTGLATLVSDCSNRDEVVEFRANGDWDTFSFRAAPGVEADSSDLELTVDLYNGSDFIDGVTVAYGKTGGLQDVDISEVSALKIVARVKDGECQGETQAVLYDMSVT
ncbi:hypothetical protein [Auraticoccus monumenti]|uniref:NPCBM/NEW2 domain-containing protein n=1 Tax=Auraticoccus monumenti TaxID=675864 RepID=A0A1G7EGS8_9ACTN|nr:hypothetical protein [Auraticoccus monumenti]SDE62899.1 hypothetical protein SAMN04489747_3941 [Auraticoccus monumenti]